MKWKGIGGMQGVDRGGLWVGGVRLGGGRGRAWRGGVCGVYEVYMSWRKGCVFIW